MAVAEVAVTMRSAFQPEYRWETMCCRCIPAGNFDGGDYHSVIFDMASHRHHTDVPR